MIPAHDVRAAIAHHGHDAFSAAMGFNVSERTVRRWQRTGLPLFYGAVNVTREQWEQYVESGSSGRHELMRIALEGQVSSSKPVRRRTGVDRQLPVKAARLSKVKPPLSKKGKQRPAPGRRLRTSRELLRAWKAKR